LRKEVNDNFYHIQTQAPDASSISGANQQQRGSSSDICTDNPYMLSVNETFEELHKASKMWLTNLPQHLLKAAGDRYKAHDHQKFFPFESMGTCNEISCIGGKCSADTSKIACGISNLRRLDSCIVYSIGGNNQWEFELDILEKTNCEVHTFDCSGPVQRFVKPENDRLHFHHICLGATRSAGPLAEGKPCILKLDIEGWEWTIFDQDYASAALGLNLPMQLLMEVHYCAGRRNPRLLECRVQHNHTLETASDVVRFQSHLLKNGYVVVNRDDNPSCPWCTELTLLRVSC